MKSGTRFVCLAAIALLGYACTDQSEVLPTDVDASQLTMAADAGTTLDIQDASAIAFSNRLYQALAAGLTVDEAVVAGRLAVVNLAGAETRPGENHPGIENRDWGVPVLYLRADQAVLFPAPEPQPARLKSNMVMYTRLK